MPRPDVSVCIVNWNCRHHLRACLRSLQAATDVEVEIVVVDNGSTDGAPEMVARAFPGVILVRNACNVGFARANNQAARLARGRYLFFLNNDTVVPPGALRRLVDYARAHPEVGIIGPRLCDRRGDTQLSCRRPPTVAALLHRVSWLRWTGLFRRAYHRYRGRDAGGEDVRPAEVLMGAALLVSRRAFRDCGPWDEDYTFGGEDIDLCTRVARRYAVVHYPGVAITHFGRVSSRRHAGHAYTQTALGIVRYLRKAGCPRPALWFYKAALTLDLPLRWVGHAAHSLWRRAGGRPAEAARSRLLLRGVGHFLARGLEPLWRI